MDSFLDPWNKNTIFEHIETSREKVNDLLLSYEINVERVREMNVADRNTYLIDAIATEAYVSEVNEEIKVSGFDDGIGILLIKPEILPFGSLVIDYLEDSGFEAKALEHVYPSHSDWMDTYGYMLKRYPDVINVYIMQRSLGFQPVLFRHLSSDAYGLLLKSRGMSPPKDGDEDALFDQLFCGEADEEHLMTLRGNVSLPIMRRYGFDNMSGYASLFDPVDYFKDMGMLKNYRAYNGIHIPSNSVEKRRNLQTFLRHRSDSDA